MVAPQFIRLGSDPLRDGHRTFCRCPMMSGNRTLVVGPVGCEQEPPLIRLDPAGPTDA